MSVVDQIEAMPDEGLLPASYLKEAVEEIRKEAITLAATEEGTIQMWCELATRNYCEDPTKTYGPVDGTDLADTVERDADRDTDEGMASWMTTTVAPEPAGNGGGPRSGPTSPGGGA